MDSFIDKLRNRKVDVNFHDESNAVDAGTGGGAPAGGNHAGFLNKLKSRGLRVIHGETSEKNGNKTEKTASPRNDDGEVPTGAAPLDIDMYQTDSEIIIVAKVPGTDPHDLDISTEADSDIVIIRSKSHSPTEEEGDKKADDEKEKPESLISECHWGDYYRRIVLPDEVNVTYADAKVTRGVLVLKLSLVRPKKGKRKIKVDDEE
jgi:HSP20 family molecular chaperone IbpA